MSSYWTQALFRGSTARRVGIPCVFIFRTENQRDLAKVKKLVVAALHPIPDENTPPRKKAKIRDTNVDPLVSQSDKIWVQMDRIRLTNADKHIISSGKKLNDLHINYAHHILKHQFPSLKGLQNTLYQSKKQPREEPTNKLQIIPEAITGLWHQQSNR